MCTRVLAPKAIRGTATVRNTARMTMTTTISRRVNPPIAERRPARGISVHRPEGDLGHAAGVRRAGRQIGRVAEPGVELPVTLRRVVIAPPAPDVEIGPGALEQ